jgi:hypothetical protein
MLADARSGGSAHPAHNRGCATVLRLLTRAVLKRSRRVQIPGEPRP